jgi:hypothetical protein
MSSEQNQYIIQQVDFTTERFPEEIFDLTTSVVELNIFENIELPYLTASLAMMDDVAFKTTIGIKGSERVAIHIKATSSSNTIIKKFMVTGIAKEISVNERTDVRVLTLIEEHAYLSAIQKISEAYTGVPENIIENILSSHLDKQLAYNNENFDVQNFAAQNKMKVIIPQWPPLEAVDWLRDRMSTENGSPFFLFATLRNDDIHLDDLSTLINTTAWNVNTPYTYAQSSHNLFAAPDNADTQIRQLFHVKSYAASSIESTLRLSQSGALGASYDVFNLTSGAETQDGFHSGRDTINQFMIDLGYDPADGIAFDDNLEIGVANKGLLNIGSYRSKVFSSVVASRQFYDEDGSQLAGYHDENGNAGLYKLKIKSAALRSLLMNNVFTISVPGQPYLLDPLAGVGSTIMLDYAMPTTDPTNNTQIDPDRSGKFLVYKARHKFVDGIYDTQMDIVKLTKSTGSGS